MEIKDIASIVRREKEKLELDIRDDVELMELAFNHILYIERDSNQSLQDILAVDAKLQYMQEHFVASNKEESSSGYIEMIRTKLARLNENISLAGLGEHDHMTYMMTEYEIFCVKCEGKGLAEIYRSGLIFLSQMVDYLNNHYVESLELNKLVVNIREDKGIMSEIIHQEPLEYLVARKKSLKSLQVAYQHIHALNDLMQKNKLGIEHPRHIRQITSVANTLMWSSSLGIAEQKWLDARSSSKAKMILAEVGEYKAPIRMAYSFILALIIERLSQKNGDLTRVKHIQKQLAKPKSSSMLAGGLQGSPVEAKTILAKRSVNMRVKIEAELDDLRLVKDVVFAQSLKIFFNEWKLKACGEEKSSKVMSFITRMPLAARLQITGSELTERSSEEDEDEEQYSINDLEEMFGASMKK